MKKIILVFVIGVVIFCAWKQFVSPETDDLGSRANSSLEIETATSSGRSKGTTTRYHGTVVDAHGVPLDGANVELRCGNEVLKSRTDRGQFEIDSHAEVRMPCEIIVDHEVWGHLETEFTDGSIVRYEALSRIVGLTRAERRNRFYFVDIMPGAGVLRGLSSWSEPGQQDFVIDELAPGSYTVRAHCRKGIVEREVSIERNGQEVQIAIDSEEAHVATAELSGAVLLDGELWENAVVEWSIRPVSGETSPSARSALVTDGEGNYAIENALLIPGFTTVQFVAEGVQPVTIELDEVTDGKANLEFFSTKQRLVQIIDSLGLPIAGTPVVVPGHRIRQHTDGDGFVSVSEDVTQVTAEVRVVPEGSETFFATFKGSVVIPGADQEVTVLSVPGEGILVRHDQAAKNDLVFLAAENHGIVMGNAPGSVYIGSVPSEAQLLVATVPMTRNVDSAVSYFGRFDSEVRGELTLNRVRWNELSKGIGTWFEPSQLGFLSLARDLPSGDCRKFLRQYLWRHKSNAVGIPEIEGLSGAVCSLEGHAAVKHGRLASDESEDHVFVSGRVDCFQLGKQANKIMRFSELRLTNSDGEHDGWLGPDGSFLVPGAQEGELQLICNGSRFSLGHVVGHSASVSIGNKDAQSILNSQ